MKVEQALNQISEIHQHLNKTEIYRGLRALPVAFTGILGIIGAALQNYFITPNPSLYSFTLYWFCIAAICIIPPGIVALYRYVYTETSLERRKTRQVTEQFIPCVIAGLIVMIITIIYEKYYHPNNLLDSHLHHPLSVLYEQVSIFLAGLWAIILGLGLFAMRPFLPLRIGFPALYYLLAGGILLLLAIAENQPSPWNMGLTFGIGQIITSAVLYWNLERKKND
jgi:hypothetical protein